jgi:hypothetical protein
VSWPLGVDMQGGGYAIRNVARCWAYETSVLLDVPISDAIPKNDYYEYYGPEYKLHLTVRRQSKDLYPHATEGW